MNTLSAILKCNGSQIGEVKIMEPPQKTDIECWTSNCYGKRTKICSLHGNLSGKLHLDGFIEKSFKRRELNVLDAQKFELEIPAEKIILNHLRFTALDYEECYEDPEKEIVTIRIKSVKFAGWIIN